MKLNDLGFIAMYDNEILLKYPSINYKKLKPTLRYVGRIGDVLVNIVIDFDGRYYFIDTFGRYEHIPVTKELSEAIKNTMIEWELW